MQIRTDTNWCAITCNNVGERWRGTPQFREIWHCASFLKSGWCVQKHAQKRSRINHGCLDKLADFVEGIFIVSPGSLLRGGGFRHFHRARRKLAPSAPFCCRPILLYLPTLPLFAAWREEVDHLLYDQCTLQPHQRHAASDQQ